MDNSTLTHSKKVIIIGGGFAGIRAALALAKKNIPGLEITLISDKPHFEYYPTLYRVVVGYSALQVCVPLSEIFAGKKVNVVEDYISKVELKEKRLHGGLGTYYEYDYLVLALGSETGYFNIPGLPEYSYGFKSIHEALELKRHIHEVLTPQPALTPPQPEQNVISAHFMIVGGGPTGIELAAELVHYAQHLAKKHGYDPSNVTIDIIEAAPRLLPIMPPDFSEEVKQQLHRRGVNIFLNRAVIKQEMEELLMKDMSVKTKTVIWTAGVKNNRLIAQIEGLELDKRGKVVVNDHMQAKGVNNVFIIGDSASTQYSGMAQTADVDGKYVANFIWRKLTGQNQIAYVPKKPIYAIPAGHGWAAILWGNTRIYGKLGWWLRHAADLRYFMNILPIPKAVLVFRKSSVLSETCPICTNEEPLKKVEKA